MRRRREAAVSIGGAGRGRVKQSFEKQGGVKQGDGKARSGEAGF